MRETDLLQTMHDMMSQTDSVMPMGKGSIQTISSKQKINTRGLTEDELVGVDDVIACTDLVVLDSEIYASFSATFQS